MHARKGEGEGEGKEKTVWPNSPDFLKLLGILPI